MHQLIDKKNKIIIYILLLLILSTTTAKFLEIKNIYPSKVNKVNVKGLLNANSSQILNELNDLFYKNILLINSEEIQKVMSKYNIIEEYSIKKVYPSTININIKPTKFVARLSGNNQLVGANGKLILGKENNEKLPYIFGEFNSEEFLILKNKIEQSNFTFSQFKMLYFFPSNRWDILTYDNILIKLPRNDVIKSLELTYKIIISNDLKNKNFIDLRMKNQLILR